MPDCMERATTTLRLIRLVKVVSADDAVPAREAGRDRITIGVVVGRAVGPPRDVVVDLPSSAPDVVRVRHDHGLRVAFVAVSRKMHAQLAVGECVWRAGGLSGARRSRRDEQTANRHAQRRGRGGTAAEREGEERRERGERDAKHGASISVRACTSIPPSSSGSPVAEWDRDG
jgi:hypothetical protein